MGAAKKERIRNHQPLALANGGVIPERMQIPLINAAPKNCYRHSTHNNSIGSFNNLRLFDKKHCRSQVRTKSEFGFEIANSVKQTTLPKKKVIAVTCHYDIVDWLEPDWVFCTDTMVFDRKKELGRPLNSKSIGAALPGGKYFGNITI